MKMRKISFVFNAVATCVKEIYVPLDYKIEGKSYDEIYDEVYHLYGDKDGEYLNKNLVGMDQFDDMNIIVENIALIFNNKSDEINMAKNSIKKFDF